MHHKDLMAFFNMRSPKQSNSSPSSPLLQSEDFVMLHFLNILTASTHETLRREALFDDAVPMRPEADLTLRSKCLVRVMLGS